MRSPSPLAPLWLAAGAAACSGVPGLEYPQIALAPQYTSLRWSGRAQMQSSDGSGGVRQNPPVAHRELGLGHHDDDAGIAIECGDGFSGADFGYLRLDQYSTLPGTLSSDFGGLMAGDAVTARVTMDELRLRYVAALLDVAAESGVGFELGAGAALAHRNVKMRFEQSGGARGQRLALRDDGVPYLAARARLSYRVFGLRADYAISPHAAFGGDFDGTLWDLEVLGTFTFTDQDLTAFGGYRRSALPARGSEGGFAYDTDFSLDGWVLGVRFIF